MYEPTKGDDEEKERLWSNEERLLNRLVNEYRLCMIGDLNGKAEDKVKEEIFNAFVLPCEIKMKDSGRLLC